MKYVVIFDENEKETFRCEIPEHITKSGNEYRFSKFKWEKYHNIDPKKYEHVEIETDGVLDNAKDKTTINNENAENN